MIYFAQLPTGSIKIGFTKDVESRMQSLGSHHGVEPALLATLEGDRSTEAEIHGRFAHLRLGRTEQFKPGPDLMAFIGKPLLVGLNPDAVEAVEPASELRVVRLALPPGDHKEFRKLAAAEETNMALLARRIVQEYIARHRPKAGAK